MAVATRSVTDVCAGARGAARAVATSTAEVRNGAVTAMADLLEQRADEILGANGRDLEAGREAGLTDALIDRLTLTRERIDGIARDTRAIAALPDPIGEVLEERRLDNGLDLQKLRVPLGVVAVVYEARPNVTIDCSALCVKSGNAIVLRGSSSAEHSNAVLAGVAADAVASVGLPAEAVSIVSGGSRDELAQLATQDASLDLIIPRGGEGLKRALTEHATVPVLYAADGNCHVFVDAGADVQDAVEIIVNAKVQRPGVCNAAETLLVHADIASEFLPAALARLQREGVELRVDGRSRSAAGPLDGLVDATAEDWETEFLALVLAVGVVDSVDEAIDHINRYGSGHSEAILTGSDESAERFAAAVDAACVYVNASTRFSDGAEFGLGAEIGNSTQKLHARGPIGLRELCSYKYVLRGSGQVRP